MTEIKWVEAALMRDRRTNVSLLQVLRRGTAQLLRAEPEGILLRDTVSGAYLLSADYSEAVLEWMLNLPDCSLILTTDPDFLPPLREHYHLGETLSCRQYVYEKETPIEYLPQLTIEEPDSAELCHIKEIYSLLTPAEIDKIHGLHHLFVGKNACGDVVGMVGSHLEGCMGLLEVYPTFRGHGYGAELESWLINRFLSWGLIPFCQVVRGNDISCRLQQKLGLLPSAKEVYFLF